MTEIAPGWYRDPVDPAIQRYWDGQCYVGDPLPADAPPAHPDQDGRDSQDGTPAASVTSIGPWASGDAWPAADPTVAGTDEPDRGPRSPLIPRVSRPTYPPMLLVAPRPHEYALASLGARFVARLIDVAILFVLTVAVNGWFAYQWILLVEPVLASHGTQLPPPRAQTLELVMILTTAALWLAYEVPQVADRGQTLGKRLARVKIVRLDKDEPPGLRLSLRRWNSLGLPTLLWTCACVGFLWQLIDCAWAAFDQPLHQALHDKSAGTVVVAVNPALSAHGPHDIHETRGEQDGSP